MGYEAKRLPHLPDHGGNVTGPDLLPVLPLPREHFVQERLRPGCERVHLVDQRISVPVLPPLCERYISVTTVLNVLAKPALVHWAAKTAATLVLEDPEKYSTCEAAAGGIYTARDRAADRGSLVHSLIEAIARRSEVDREGVPDHIRGYMQAFLSWVSLTQPTPLFSECTVYHQGYRYAGTCDLIAAFPDRKVRMIDIKTGGIYPEVGLQLEAYRRCEYLFPRVNGDAAHLIAMPPVSETAVLLLREDGTYDYRPIIGDFEAFLAAIRLWRWTREAA